VYECVCVCESVRVYVCVLAHTGAGRQGSKQFSDFKTLGKCLRGEK